MKFVPKINFFKQNINVIFKNNLLMDKLLDRVINHYSLVEKSEGIGNALKVHKEILRLVSRYILYQDAGKQLGPRWIKTNSLGIPKCLRLTGPEIRSLRSNPDNARMVLTVLSYYKIHAGPIDYSTSTITDPCKNQDVAEIIQEIKTKIPKILRDLDLSSYTPKNDFPLHVTTKAGGHGPKAMGVTSILDLRAVSEEGLLVKIKELYSLLLSKENNSLLLKLVESSESSPTFQDPEYKTKSSARLHFIAEGGGKTRVICIGDIWTQMALKPIHDFLMSGLKRIPNDGTSSHNRIATQLCEWSTSQEFYCFDLTAATDRMPIALQREVLLPLFGEAITDLWETLLVDRDIDFRGQPIRYSVGQPMGFLSSWASMAITHHIIINYAYELNGVLPQDRKYCVIGDDVAISNKCVAESYVKLLDKLGIEISLGKSIVPNKGHNSCELAKRFFRDGIELSPITPQLIELSSNSLSDMLSLDRTLSDRSYYPLPDSQTKDCGNYRGQLDRSHIISSLALRLKEEEMIKAHIYLTSPLFAEKAKVSKINLEFINEAPFTGVSSLIWKNIYGFTHKWDQFLLNLVAEKIVKYEDDVRKYNVQLRRSAADKLDIYSPIVGTYFVHSMNEIKKIFRVYNTQYEDETGDSDDLLDQTDPNYVLMEIICRPNPMDAPSFQRRVAEHRQNITELLLIRFLKNERMAKANYEQLLKDYKK